MLNSVSSKKSNEEATLDAHNRSQDHVNKRRVVRLRRYKPAVAIYGFVQFNQQAGGPDYSLCEICNSDGTRITSPTIGWVDTHSGMLPVAFGDSVYFQLQLIGTAKPDFITTRNLYRIVSYGGWASGTVSSPRIFSTTSSSAGRTLGTLMTSGAAAIQTTINAVAGNNVVYCDLSNQGTPVAGTLTDLPRPLQWNVNNTLLPQLIPEYLTRRRLGTRASTTLSIDWGESFRIDVQTSLFYSVLGNPTAYDNQYESVFFTGSVDFTFVGGGLSGAAVYQTIQQAWVTTPVTVGGSGGGTATFPNYNFQTFTGSNVGVGGVDNCAVTIGTASTIVSIPGIRASPCALLQCNITQNGTTKRITGITLALASVATHYTAQGISWMTTGGREDYWAGNG